jgi:hypothetical protein
MPDNRIPSDWKLVPTHLYNQQIVLAQDLLEQHSYKLEAELIRKLYRELLDSSIQLDVAYHPDASIIANNTLRSCIAYLVNGNSTFVDTDPDLEKFFKELVSKKDNNVKQSI